MFPFSVPTHSCLGVRAFQPWHLGRSSLGPCWLAQGPVPHADCGFHCSSLSGSFTGGPFAAGTSRTFPCPVCFQNASKESSGGKCQAQPCNPYCLTVLPESAPLGTLVLSDEVPSLCLSWKRLGCQKCGYKCEPHFGEVNTIWSSSASTIRTAACGRVPYATYRAVQSPNQ